MIFAVDWTRLLLIFKHTHEIKGMTQRNDNRWLLIFFAAISKVISHVHVLSAYHVCRRFFFFSSSARSLDVVKVALICEYCHNFFTSSFDVEEKSQEKREYVRRRKSIKSDLNAYSNEKIMNSFRLSLFLNIAIKIFYEEDVSEIIW